MHLRDTLCCFSAEQERGQNHPNGPLDKVPLVRPSLGALLEEVLPHAAASTSVQVNSLAILLFIVGALSTMGKIYSYFSCFMNCSISTRNGKCVTIDLHFVQNKIDLDICNNQL